MGRWFALWRRKRRFSSPLFFLLLSLLFASACNWFHPEVQRETDRRELAARFKEIVLRAGGKEMWIKHPVRSRAQRRSEPWLQVVAAPAASDSIQSALRREAEKEQLSLETTTATSAGGRHAVNIRVLRREQSIFQIQIREAARLLRAAIVIDDIGQDLEAAHKLLALNYPLTYSVLPHLRYSEVTAQDAHHSGREVMLHLPMQPEGSTRNSPGAGAILVGMNAAEVQRVVLGDLDSVPYVVGVNNHMGSLATQDAALMASVMRVLAKRQLYFIDSRTTGSTQALEAAHGQNVPSFYRSVFLDNTESVSYTLGQLREFRQRVEHDGVALAIGHPHPTTIAALAKFLPEFEQADIELVAPSQLVRLPELARLKPPNAGKRVGE